MSLHTFALMIVLGPPSLVSESSLSEKTDCWNVLTFLAFFFAPTLDADEQTDVTDWTSVSAFSQK